MRLEKHTSVIEFATYQELDVDRQKEIYNQALKDNMYYDFYAQTMWQDYRYLVNNLQEEHDLDIEPIFSQGSQHYLEGFAKSSGRSDNSTIVYKNVDFDFSYNRGRKEVIIDINFYEEQSPENEVLAKELKAKIELFISEYMKIYNVFQEHFMYGYCDDYERFVQDELFYGDLEYEKVIDLQIQVIEKGE